MTGKGRESGRAGAAARLRCFVAPAALVVIALFVLSGSASAAGPRTSAAEAKEFTLPVTHATPGSIAAGPDGAMWFSFSKTSYNGGASYAESEIGRITPGGKITYFKLPPNSSSGGVYALVAGPDGALWYLTRDAVGRMTTGGQVTEFPHERIWGPIEGDRGAITVGPDGNLWFVGATPGVIAAPAIARITPSGEVSEIPFSSAERASPQAIAWGADGNLWFAERFGDVIGHVSTTGQFTEYPVPGAPRDLILGPDGVPWYTSTEGIGRISLSGELSPVVPFPGGGRQMASGPDGRLWFSSGTEGVIGRIDPNGLISEVTLQSSHRNVSDIAAGPKGSVWYLAEDDTGCEGGGATCMAFDAFRKPVIIGRIDALPPRAAVRAVGSAVGLRQGRLEIACMDGGAFGACSGSMRLVIPNGPPVAKRRFRLATDTTQTIVLAIGRQGRRAIATRGNDRLIAVVETKGGQTTRRRLALRPPQG